MTARDQVFQGVVNGDVAGRDVFVNHIHMPQERPESELQAAFQRNTGIHCNRDAREQFELLMREHRFTSRELARAWKARAVYWSDVDHCLKSNQSRWELYYVLAFLFSATVGFLWVLYWIAIEFDSILVRVPLVFALSICQIGLVFFFSLTTVFPQTTAQRFERVQHHLPGSDKLQLPIKSTPQPPRPGVHEFVKAIFNLRKEKK